MFRCAHGVPACSTHLHFLLALHTHDCHEKAGLFFVFRICGRIVHSVWVACMAWWRPAVQLLLTGVPRANFRRGVRPSISPRSKVITVRPLKLESSNVPRVNGHDGCLVCDHFFALRSRFLALARPRDYGSLTGGNLMMRCGDTRCTVSCIASQAPRCSLLDSGRRWAWLLHVWQTMVSARDARCLQRTSCTRANEQYRLLELVGPCRCQFSRTHCLARLRVQESRRQAWRCSPSKSPSVS